MSPHLPRILVGLGGGPAHNLGHAVGLAAPAAGQGRGGGGGGCRWGAGGEDTPVGEGGQTHLNTACTTTTTATAAAEMEACIMDVIITAWCLIN